MTSRKGSLWSSAEIECLLAFWADKNIQQQLDKTHKNADIYGQFADHLTVRGFVRSIEQCRAKVKKLRLQYLKVRDVVRKSDCSSDEKDTFPWYEAVDNIIGNKPTSDSSVVDSQPTIAEVENTRPEPDVSPSINLPIGASDGPGQSPDNLRKRSRLLERESTAGERDVSPSTNLLIGASDGPGQSPDNLRKRSRLLERESTAGERVDCWRERRLLERESTAGERDVSPSTNLLIGTSDGPGPRPDTRRKRTADERDIVGAFMDLTNKRHLYFSQEEELRSQRDNASLNLRSEREAQQREDHWKEERRAEREERRAERRAEREERRAERRAEREEQRTKDAKLYEQNENFMKMMLRMFESSRQRTAHTQPPPANYHHHSAPPNYYHHTAHEETPQNFGEQLRAAEPASDTPSSTHHHPITGSNDF